MIPDEIQQPGPAPIGHNSGSMLEMAREELSGVLRERIQDGGRTFEQRRDEFLASAAAQTVKDRQSAADAADTIKMAGEVWALIDAARRTLSDPYRDTHLTLSSDASQFWEGVTASMEGLRDQIDAWTAEEDKRIAAQRAEQQEQMAGWAPPRPPGSRPRAQMDYSSASGGGRSPAREPRRSKIRGDLGATISARAVVTYEIEDISLLPDHIMQSPTVREAILTVVRATAKHMGVPKGIRVHHGTDNQIR